MVNEDHSPADDEEEILEIMKAGREEGDPWGHATPRYLREQGVDSVDFHLRQLTTAGWIKKMTRGFYQFVDDPREDNNGD